MVYYFTLSYDQGGGWVKVVAEDDKSARFAFDCYHPGVQPAGMYDAMKFRGTSMFNDGNFGKKCVEVITLTKQEMAV